MIRRKTASSSTINNTAFIRLNMPRSIPSSQKRPADASKWAIEGFSESLYYELAQLNITVKVVEPGNVATDFTGRSLDLHTDDSLQEYHAYYQAIINKQLESFKNNAAGPELVASVVYDAATDQSGRFRYLAGAEAAFLMEMRRKSTDEENDRHFRPVTPEI